MLLLRLVTSVNAFDFKYFRDLQPCFENDYKCTYWGLEIIPGFRYLYLSIKLQEHAPQDYTKWLFLVENYWSFIRWRIRPSVLWLCLWLRFMSRSCFSLLLNIGSRYKKQFIRLEEIELSTLIAKVYYQCVDIDSNSSVHQVGASLFFRCRFSKQKVTSLSRISTVTSNIKIRVFLSVFFFCKVSHVYTL